MNETKLTIVLICYNQENFISQSLDSFLMQKTDFDFQVIIADDASTDNTAKIITEYANKYPDIIKPVLRDKNIGIINNFIETLSYAKSEYLIYNEGDDYFINPLKLQKQVDFLDSNPDYSICFHPVIVKHENSPEPDKLFPPNEILDNKNSFDFKLLLKYNFIQTNSCMYRWRFCNEEKIQDVFPRNILPGDHFLHLLHAEIGKIGFIPDVMAVYRKWSGGIWAGAGVTDEWFIQCGVSHIRFYEAVEKRFDIDRSVDIEILAKRTLDALLRKHCWDKIQKFYQEFPNLYDNALKRPKDRILVKDSKKYLRYVLLSKIMFGRLKVKYNEKAEKLLRDNLA